MRLTRRELLLRSRGFTPATRTCTYISTISDDPELPEAVQKEVLQALAVAMETLAEDIARHELQSAKGFQDKSLLIQRGLLGASDFQKKLYEDAGYSVALTDRIEMTAAMKDVELSSESPNDAIEGVEIRALDILNDDLVQVYDLLMVAFGSNPPSYEAWKRHYWQQPRLAADLSFVAWYDSQPVSAVLIERLAEGEGGGDDEQEAVFHTERQLSEERAEAETNTVDNNTSLHFAEDNEQRQAKVHEIATRGFVVAVATAPAFKGRHLAQRVLQHGFQAAKKAGLDSVELCTDRQNPGAVRAYIRAGMLETKTSNDGYATARVFNLSP